MGPATSSTPFREYIFREICLRMNGNVESVESPIFYVLFYFTGGEFPLMFSCDVQAVNASSEE